MEQRHGYVSLDELARQTSVCMRQFRRLCVNETGLSPKLLARVLRFRHASKRANSEIGEHSRLAIECGYADQAHMIAEFRYFSGATPARPEPDWQ